MAALIPLTDVLSLQAARRTGFAFAWPRGCGSAAFVIANAIRNATGATVRSLPLHPHNILRAIEEQKAGGTL